VAWRLRLFHFAGFDFLEREGAPSATSRDPRINLEPPSTLVFSIIVIIIVLTTSR
jgi:hypothetical protein